MRKQPWLIRLGSALIIGGAVLLGLYFWMQHSADKVQREARESLSRMITNHQPAPPATKLARRRLHRGDIIGELSVPRLRLSVIVFEGDDAGILKNGAGHIPATALPRDSGNTGIAAHRDTYFRPLQRIRPNDTITFKTPRETLRYTVSRTEIVQPSDIGVLAKAPGRDLTLVTCYPFHFVGSAPERFIVHARRID
jgi:sortase A